MKISISESKNSRGKGKKSVVSNVSMKSRTSDRFDQMMDEIKTHREKVLESKQNSHTDALAENNSTDTVNK